jgi:hypothetical protein
MDEHAEENRKGDESNDKDLPAAGAFLNAFRQFAEFRQ